MLHLSEFVWTLRSSVWVVFIKRFFIALSLYPLSFFANTPFKIWTLDFLNHWPAILLVSHPRPQNRLTRVCHPRPKNRLTRVCHPRPQNGLTGVSHPRPQNGLTGVCHQHKNRIKRLKNVFPRPYMFIKTYKKYVLVIQQWKGFEC